MLLRVKILEKCNLIAPYNYAQKSTLCSKKADISHGAFVYRFVQDQVVKV